MLTTILVAYAKWSSNLVAKILATKFGFVPDCLLWGNWEKIDCDKSNVTSQHFDGLVQDCSNSIANACSLALSHRYNDTYLSKLTCISQQSWVFVNSERHLSCAVCLLCKLISTEQLIHRIRPAAPQERLTLPECSRNVQGVLVEVGDVTAGNLASRQQLTLQLSAILASTKIAQRRPVSANNTIHIINDRLPFRNATPP